MPSVKAKYTQPSEAEMAQAAQFGFWVGGTIFDPSGAILWRFHLSPKPRFPFPMGLFLKYSFVVTNAAGEEALRIRRLKRFAPIFEIVQDGQPVGEITYHNFIRTRCTISLAGGAVWHLSLPLLTVFFYGESDAGDRLWIRVGPRKSQWNLLATPAASHVSILSAIAFLHREYWNH